jgi:hypothetical protein
VRGQLEQAEPPFAGYRRTLDALQRYLGLERQGDGEQLPAPPMTIDARRAVLAPHAVQCDLNEVRCLGQCNRAQERQLRACWLDRPEL